MPKVTYKDLYEFMKTLEPGVHPLVDWYNHTSREYRMAVIKSELMTIDNMDGRTVYQIRFLPMNKVDYRIGANVTPCTTPGDENFNNTSTFNLSDKINFECPFPASCVPANKVQALIAATVAHWIFKNAEWDIKNQQLGNVSYRDLYDYIQWVGSGTYAINGSSDYVLRIGMPELGAIISKNTKGKIRWDDVYNLYFRNMGGNSEDCIVNVVEDNGDVNQAKFRCFPCRYQMYDPAHPTETFWPEGRADWKEIQSLLYEAVGNWKKREAEMERPENVDDKVENRSVRCETDFDKFIRLNIGMKKIRALSDYIEAQHKIMTYVLGDCRMTVLSMGLDDRIINEQINELYITGKKAAEMVDKMATELNIRMKDDIDSVTQWNGIVSTCVGPYPSVKVEDLYEELDVIFKKHGIWPEGME